MEPSLYETAELASSFTRTNDRQGFSYNVNSPMSESLIDIQRDENFHYINDVMGPSMSGGIPTGLLSPLSECFGRALLSGEGSEVELLVSVENSESGEMVSSFVTISSDYLPSDAIDVVHQLVDIGDLPADVTHLVVESSGNSDFVEIVLKEGNRVIYTIEATPLLGKVSGYTNPSDSYPGVQFPMDSEEVEPTHLYPQNTIPMSI